MDFLELPRGARGQLRTAVSAVAWDLCKELTLDEELALVLGLPPEAWTRELILDRMEIGGKPAPAAVVVAPHRLRDRAIDLWGTEHKDLVHQHCVEMRDRRAIKNRELPTIRPKAKWELWGRLDETTKLAYLDRASSNMEVRPRAVAGQRCVEFAFSMCL